MAKWCGNIGYSETVEVEPGLWEEQITVRPYFGELITDRRKRQASGNVNDDINLANVISILADPFAVQNCSKMVYAEVMGAKWKITDIEVQHPRLKLTVGGVWNENSSGTSSQT